MGSAPDGMAVKVLEAEAVHAREQLASTHIRFDMPDVTRS